MLLYLAGKITCYYLNISCEKDIFNIFMLKYTMNKINIENAYNYIENNPKCEIFSLAFPMTLIYKSMFNKKETIMRNNYNINHSEVDVLFSLYFNGYIQSPTELYENTIFSSGGMTKILKNLEKSNYISRVPDEKDKRSLLVKLEEKGAKIATELLEICIEENNKLFSVLDEEEKKVMKKALRKLCDNI